MREQRTNLTVESNIKHYLLACSKANRAGKFTRVSQETIDEVTALVDSVIRQIESKVPQPLHPLPYGPGLHVDELRLITGYALEKCRERLEVAARKIIANKVQSTPSCGITL